MYDTPTTRAFTAVREAGIHHRAVSYGRVRSAEEAAAARGIELGALVKTLVVRVEEARYVLVLIPGDASLDYKKLRSHLGVRRLTMPDPDEAKQATGYERGTITPLGAGPIHTIVDSSLMFLPEISLGSGAHGWAIHMAPDDLVAVLDDVEVADIAG